MKVLVAGCGNIGSVAAADLAKNMKDTEIVVADYHVNRAENVARRIGEANVSWRKIDVSDSEDMAKVLRDFDLTLGSLPGRLGYRLMKECIDAGKNLVDVSFTAENPLKLNDGATTSNVKIVPDCGLAPGISNFLVGHATMNLDDTESIHVMVGGLPKTKTSPLGYVITWSPESLIDEYTRKARIIRESKLVEADAFSEVEEINFPKVGNLEAFLTDGLRTLLFTVCDVQDMWEKTLRYPGHAERVKTLKDLGFFDEKKIEVGDVSVSPRRLTVKLLTEKLWKPEAKDIVVLRVSVSGYRGGKKITYVYNMLDYFDLKGRVTAMARTTAYPASIVAQLMLKGKIREKGVIPPEKLGADDRLFRLFCSELGTRGIKISEEIVKE